VSTDWWSLHVVVASPMNCAVWSMTSPSTSIARTVSHWLVFFVPTNKAHMQAMNCSRCRKPPTTSRFDCHSRTHVTAGLRRLVGSIESPPSIGARKLCIKITKKRDHQIDAIFEVEMGKMCLRLRL